MCEIECLFDLFWLYSGPWEARSFASWTSQQSACVLNHDVVLIQFLLLVLGVATELTCCNMLQLAHKTGVAVPVTALMPSSCISKCCPDAILSNVMFSLSTEKVAAPCSSFGVQKNRNDWSRLESASRSVQQFTQHQAPPLRISLDLAILGISTDLYRSLQVLRSSEWTAIGGPAFLSGQSLIPVLQGCDNKDRPPVVCKDMWTSHLHLIASIMIYVLFHESYSPKIQRRWKASKDHALDRPTAGRKPHNISQLCWRSKVWKQDPSRIQNEDTRYIEIQQNPHQAAAKCWQLQSCPHPQFGTSKVHVLWKFQMKKSDW